MDRPVIETLSTSEYARLVGVLFIEVPGLIGDGAIVLAWPDARYAGKRQADHSA